MTLKILKRFSYYLYILLSLLVLLVGFNAFALEEDQYTYQAVKFGLEEKWYEADNAALKSLDPAFTQTALQALKIYNSPQAINIEETIKFLRNNSWLCVEIFTNKIEKILNYQASPADVIKWYKFSPSQTKAGKFILLNAELERGIKDLKNKTVKDDLRKLWRTTEFESASEEYFIKKYKDHLTVEDLLRKIEHLTWRHSFSMAEKLINILPPSHKRLPAQRLNLARSMSKQINFNIPGELKNDELTQYFVIESRLKREDDKLALKHILSLKAKNNPEKWWKLRNIILRNCLRDRLYVDAYRLASESRLESGIEFAEAEWLAGWIALRFLKDSEKAIAHFKHLYENVKLSNSKSKAAYWLARSYFDNNEKEKAEQWYDIASRYVTTFYGQIAAWKTKNSHNGFISSIREEDFNDADSTNLSAKNIALFSFYLFKAGQKYLAYNLIKALPDFNLKAYEVKEIAEFYNRKNLQPLAVELGKVMANKSNISIVEGYPKSIKIVNNKLPKALYLGIIRQESNFDQSAISVAGARGLMQIMPNTAAKLAKILGLSKNSYIDDPNANVLKGVKYVDELFDNYDSIMLTVAAYNAGPGNVSKWIKRYDDPRKFKSFEEKIDWIESIPFSETRNYVKKVFENFVIYNDLITHDNKKQSIINFFK